MRRPPYEKEHFLFADGIIARAIFIMTKTNVLHNENERFKNENR